MYSNCCQYAGPGIVAFAHGKENTTRDISMSILDTTTMTFLNQTENWTDSEPICLQYQRNDNDVNSLLLGLRDGSLALVDTRSSSASPVVASTTTPNNNASKFGSVTSVQPLQDGRLVIAKGSFGSCRIFDVRRMNNNRDKSLVRQQKQQQQSPSLLMELHLPDSIVHPTKSVRCTGLAIDPTESVAIAPFAASSDHNGGFGDIMFALWDVTSGALLRTMSISQAFNRSHNQTESSLGDTTAAGNNKGYAPLFCELSNVVTPGYEMSCKNNNFDGNYYGNRPIISSKEISFGLWFKTNVESPCDPSSPQPDGGSIHHLRF